MSKTARIHVRPREEITLNQLASSFRDGDVFRVSFLRLRRSAIGLAHGPLRGDSAVCRAKRDAFSDRVDKNWDFGNERIPE